MISVWFISYSSEAENGSIGSLSSTPLPPKKPLLCVKQFVKVIHVKLMLPIIWEECVCKEIQGPRFEFVTFYTSYITD